MPINEKIDIESDTIEKVGFFYIFSRYWLPFFIVIAALGVLYFIVMNSGILNLLQYWDGVWPTTY